MPIRVRSFLPLLLPLAIACTAQDDTCDPAPAPRDAAAASVATTKTVDPAAVTTVEVDARPPTLLTHWRTVKQAGETAARVVDLDARIAQSRTFLAEHPQHQTATTVLEALADALVDRGNFDAAELAAHVEALARLEPRAGAPTKLIVKYHLAHGLPRASAMTLLALARERLTQEERELALLKDEDAREWRTRQIAASPAPRSPCWSSITAWSCSASESDGGRAQTAW